MPPTLSPAHPRNFARGKKIAKNQERSGQSSGSAIDLLQKYNISARFFAIPAKKALLRRRFE